MSIRSSNSAHQDTSSATWMHQPWPNHLSLRSLYMGEDMRACTRCWTSSWDLLQISWVAQALVVAPMAKVLMNPATAARHASQMPTKTPECMQGRSS
jgi:hypothetical protein